jgi:hypothetical protein
MNRKTRRRQITELATPLLDEGEEVLGAATAWVARLGRAPLLFTGRHLHRLALTDRRLIVFPRGHRRGREAAPVLSEPLEQLTLSNARARLTLYQVLLVTHDGRPYALEFRRRDHATGRALSRMLEASRQV